MNYYILKKTGQKRAHLGYYCYGCVCSVIIILMRIHGKINVIILETVRLFKSSRSCILKKIVCSKFETEEF